MTVSEIPETLGAPGGAANGAAPLGALDAAVIDTETTGLNPAEARIVQLGGCGVRAGAPDAADVFDRLVNPGVPMPESAQAVHGITDKNLAGAETFAPAFAAFNAWAGARVVIGWSIGFDLAVLRAEAERAGAEPPAWRTLCARQLLEVLSLNLPDFSLEAAAAWAGVSTQGRHSALGDARIAAQVFLALIPKLAAKGVRTLAQAERACLMQTRRLDEESRAGWDAAVTPARITAAGPGDFARVDSWPFRHRCADVMRRPPVSAQPSAPLSDVLSQMMRSGVSSVFLPADKTGAGHGIVTERDILRAVDARGADVLRAPCGGFASRPLIIVREDEFIYRAAALMTQRNVRHLGVTNESGALTGALSARDLLKQRIDAAVALGQNIDSAGTAAALGRVWAGLTAAAGGLAAEGADARDTAAVISRELRALTRRAAELAEAEMTAAGMGGAPCPWALLVLGSGGRGESLLAMDQDNAVVFAEGAPGGREDKWFEHLAARTADILDAAGVSYCKGGVMAKNAAWRMDRAHWRETIGAWIGRSRPEDVMNCDIFFDSVCVRGDAELAETVRLDAMKAAAGARPFLAALRANAVNFPPPVGAFGRLRLKGGRLDVKRSGLMPVFSAARILALEHSVTARSTPERLAAVRGALEDGAGAVDDLTEAHRILLEEILAQQLRDITRGIPHGNTVAPGELTGAGRARLRWALEKVSAVKGVLGMPVFG